MPHFAYTVLTAVLLSAALALLGHRTLAQRAYAATYLFLCCAVTAVAGSWLMRLIHGA